MAWVLWGENEEGSMKGVWRGASDVSVIVKAGLQRWMQYVQRAESDVSVIVKAGLQRWMRYVQRADKS